MQTKTKYEEMILKEIRGIPAQSLPQVAKILHSLKESIIAAGVAPKKEIKKAVFVVSGWMTGGQKRLLKIYMLTGLDLAAAE